MKSYNYKIKDEAIEDIIDFSKFKKEKNILVQVFCGKDEKSYYNCLNIITKALPQAKCIGSTTDGEIFNDSIDDHSIIISISIFQKTTIKNAFSKKSDCYEKGIDLAEQLITENTKLLILFINDHNINADDFLRGIQSVNNKVIVAGGLAANNELTKNKLVSCDDRILENSAVGVSLNSEHLIVKNDFRFNWSSIGIEHNVTKAVENRVYEINGLKTAEFYKKYLGDDILESLPETSVSFPLLVKRNNQLIARALIHIYDDGSFRYSGNLKEGDIVKFGFGNAQMILKKPIIPKDKDYSNTESFFIYSCLARKKFIPDLIHMENAAYSDIADTCGFFTYGEFFHNKRKNELLNQSMTIVSLSENSDHSNKIKENEIKLDAKLNKSTKIIQTLTHLVEQSSKDYDEQSLNLEIEKINSQMLLTSQKIFLRHAVHETNTPISVIMSNIELFEMEYGKNHYLSTIEVALKNIFNIYDDLSYLVKKDQVVYPKKNIDLVDYIRSRIEFFESSANQVGSKFVFYCDTASLNINFNETKLQRIIDNNLTNAIKYTEENSNIYITLKNEQYEKNRNEYVLVISSCSQYIQYPEKVFKEYYREESTKEGFGLGLSLVKRICDEENIGISIESNEYFTSFRYVFKMENL